MSNKLKIFLVIISLFLFSEAITSVSHVDAYYYRRCAYGRCNSNSDCDDGGKCIDMNGDGKKECDNGICNTTADCLGAMNGGVAVCRDENGDGLKECANAFCPIGMTVPGANCDCSAGRTCGQTCNASVGLCGDGKSTCRYIVGPNCRTSKPFQDDTTYCVPGGAPGIETHKCVARDQYNSYALYNGNNPTVADLAYACSLIACTPSDPVAATLSTPANNSQVNLGTNNSVAITYALNGWGTACPSNNNTYDVQLSPNCSGTYQSWGSVNQFTGLTKGVTYCWRISKDNGSGIKVLSSVNRFTVINDTVNVVSAGINADVCSNGFSGVSGSPLVSNPVDYSVNFSTAAGNTYKEVWIAMVPDNTAFNYDCKQFTGNTASTIDDNVCKYMEIQDVAEYSGILDKVRLSKGAAFKLILDSFGNAVEARAYDGGVWKSITSSGDISGYGATLKEFRTNSIASVSGNNLSSNFRIRIDSMYYGKYAFYVAALITDPLGNLKTSFASPGQPYAYKRTNASASRTNWGVDLSPVAATSAFTNVKYTADGKFQVNWSFIEPNGLNLKSFITRDNTESSLNDSTGDINFNNGNLPDSSNFTTGAIRYVDINNQNGNINEGNLTTRTYTDSDTSKQTNYQFYAYARDAACNQSVVSTSATIQKPWVLSYNGDLSAAKGVIDLSLPVTLNELPDVLKDRSGNSILTDRQSVFLSTYGAISGTPDLPIRKQSKTQQYIKNYEDLTIKPPLDSGFSKWYDYLLDTVKKNAVASFVNYQTTQVLNGNTSAFLGIGAGTKAHALINGNLTVNSTAVCDTQTIFFVVGNVQSPLDGTYKNTTLKFNPDFKVSGNSNGCIFVTPGDILIDNGASATSNVSIDNSQLANYDLIESALFTDGQFITKKDVAGNGLKNDGLAIKGSVVSENVVLQRDLNLNSNQSQPAQLFYFDPRYREIFKNDLNYNKYSIREIGYIDN